MNPEVWRKVRGPTGYKTRGLFIDVQRSMREKEEYDNAPYWLERRNYTKDDKRPVFKEHFLACLDPTGYETAIKYLGSYEHWEHMMENCPWFRDAVNRWTKELEARIKSKAIAKIQEIAFSDDRQALAAAKYLATHDYNKVDGRGRPSKEEIRGKLKEAIEVSESDKADMERMGLTLIQGGKK
jgi:hypothetical protein